MKRVLGLAASALVALTALMLPMAGAAAASEPAPASAVADTPIVLAVDITPDASGLPGGPQLQKIVNGLAYLSLIALVGGVVAGGVWWGVGSGTGNSVQAAGGKRMVAICLLGAVIVGGAAGLINFFNTLGEGIS